VFYSSSVPVGCCANDSCQPLLADLGDLAGDAGGSGNSQSRQPAVLLPILNRRTPEVETG
jgi:hypothetical protein